MTPRYGLWLLGHFAKILVLDAVVIAAFGPVYIALSAIAATERRP